MRPTWTPASQWTVRETIADAPDFWPEVREVLLSASMLMERSPIMDAEMLAMSSMAICTVSSSVDLNAKSIFCSELVTFGPSLNLMQKLLSLPPKRSHLAGLEDPTTVPLSLSFKSAFVLAFKRPLTRMPRLPITSIGGSTPMKSLNSVIDCS